MKTRNARNLIRQLLSAMIPFVFWGYSLGAAPAEGEPQFFGYGGNWEGQLGLGGIEIVDHPTAVPVSSTVVMSSAGGLHSLFVTAEGSLWGMGANDMGQLGLGDDTSRNAPTHIPTAGPVILISAGYTHSLFVTEDGRLWGMGDNIAGQLGISPGEPDFAFRPVEIPTNGKVIAVSCGAHFSLFLTEDGKLWGMGDSDDGQLGILAYSVETPRHIVVNQRVTRIAAGLGFSLFVTEDGRLWFLNAGGWEEKSASYQVHGIGEGLNPHISWDVAPVELATNVVDVSASSEYFFLGSRSLDVDDSLTTHGPFRMGVSAFYVQDNGELWWCGLSDYRVTRPDPAPEIIRIKVADGVRTVSSGFVTAAYISNEGVLYSQPLLLADGIEPSMPPFHAVAEGVSFVSAGYVHYLYGLGMQYDASVSVVCTPETRNCWDLDPEGKLRENAWFEVEGRLPGRLRIEDGCLKGYISQVGVYNVVIVGNDGVNEVRLGLRIRVIPPTTTPLFLAVHVNGQQHPTEVLVEPAHGTPAETALMSFALPLGQALQMTFDWDVIKTPYSFRVVGGRMPSGLVLDGEAGTLSGVPGETGEFIFVVSVKDWRGRGYQWIRLLIE